MDTLDDRSKPEGRRRASRSLSPERSRCQRQKFVLNPFYPFRSFPYSQTPDFSGQTALHFTASKNNLDVARRLLDAKPPASTRAKDKRGQYAIHRAAAVGSTPMVELLLKNKSPINATDVAGQTPLHHAVAEGHGKFLFAEIWVRQGSELGTDGGNRRYSSCVVEGWCGDG